MDKAVGWVGIAALVLFSGCDDSSSTEADRIGVGAECSEAAECESADEDITLTCLTEFAGGYCGLEGCEGDVDCPEGSACIAYDDGNHYCFASVSKSQSAIKTEPPKTKRIALRTSISWTSARSVRPACLRRPGFEPRFP